MNTAGNYKISNLTLNKNGTNYDLRKLLVGMNLYEDIFSTMVSVNIKLIDGNKYLRKLSFDGTEILNIKLVDSYTKSIFNHKFRIHKIGDITVHTKTKIEYDLKFVSLDQFTNLKHRISKSVDSLPHIIFQDIMSEYSNRKLYHSVSSVKEKMIFPNINPIKCINMLSKRTRSDRDIADFLFFESFDGFHFESINEMLSGPVLSTYHYNIANIRDKPSEMFREKDFYQIEKINVGDMIDNLHNFSDGLYSSTLKTVDIDSKTCTTDIFKYSERKSDMSVLNKSSLRPHDDYDTGFYGIKIDPLRKYDYILYRKSMINQLKTMSTIIQVPGDFNRHVGDVISIDRKDDITNGKYLVTAANHYIDLHKHRMILECSRNSWS